MAEAEQAQNTMYVIVTGANKGIGKEIVKTLLAKENVYVFLGSRNLANGNQAWKDLAGVDKKGRVLQLDVSKEDSVKEAVETVKDTIGENKLFAIINNAGIASGGAANVLQVNVRGNYYVNHHFNDLLAEDGRIVGISSASGPSYVGKIPDKDKGFFICGDSTWTQIDEYMNQRVKSGNIGDSAYGLSKACLNAYYLWLAKQYPKRTINTCTPGYINTDLTKQWGGNKKPASYAMTVIMKLTFGDLNPQSGCFYGSDAIRSPLHCYRDPKTEAFDGSNYGFADLDL